MNYVSDKLKEILRKIRASKRLMYLLTVSVLVLFCVSLNVAFSFLTNDFSSKGANITIGTLNYNMQVNNGKLEDRVLKISKGKAEIYAVMLSSLNKYDTKYELIYHVCADETCTSFIDKPEDLDVEVSSKTINNINGIIKKHENVSITIAGINDNAATDYYIKLDLNAGYSYNELALTNQINKTYYEDDVTIVAFVDGKEVSDFPTTGNYGVIYECMVADVVDNNVTVTGIWSKDDNGNYFWKIDVYGVTKPRTVCNVTFAVKTLNRIEITTPPSKIAYAVGESFDPSGMIVTGYFDEMGAEASVELSGYTWKPDGALSKGTEKITITYMDGEVPFTVEQMITMKLTLTVDLDGGTGGPTSGGYEPGEQVTFDTPTKDGYSFGYWSISDNSTSIDGNTLTMGTGDTTITANWIAISSFEYTGGTQEYKVPVTGTYKLEVWGAQGGNSGGYGGYSIGYKTLSSGASIYVVIGGQGKVTAGGYNGGGTGWSNWNVGHYAGGGGGATHISTTNTDLVNTSKSNLIIAAGGGGGTGGNGGAGGTGGGLTGGNGSSYGDDTATGGTQSAGGSGSANGSYGQGGNGQGGTGGWGGGGGGGYYGGAAHGWVGGSGGSGYIGGVDDGTTQKATQNGARAGNGYARITFCDGVIC